MSYKFKSLACKKTKFTFLPRKLQVITINSRAMHFCPFRSKSKTMNVLGGSGLAHPLPPQHSTLPLPNYSQKALWSGSLQPKVKTEMNLPHIKMLKRRKQVLIMAMKTSVCICLRMNNTCYGLPFLLERSDWE